MPMLPFRRSRPLVAALAVSVLLGALPAAAQPAPAAAPAGVVSPEVFFGFRMGADGRLASLDRIEQYFTRVADASDRVEITTIGPTTDGNHLIAAIVSAPENIARLAEIQRVNQQLSDPRTTSPAEAKRLAASHKMVVAIGASIHASEIGATQAASEILYTLATAGDEATLAVLRDLVIVLIPSLNPDGHRLVVDWFEKGRGTPFEGGPMPWLYQKYAGHDINRDAFMMQLAENRSLADFFYRVWHPQVFLTMHQMGARGPRFFLPPNYDPIDPNYDPFIWRVAGLLGHGMALELEREGRQGVLSNAMYDYYWPGYEDSAPLGHNTVCLLTEVASVRIALPVEIAAADLTAGVRGLSEYKPQINFPNPWPGGTWRLRDIVEYELAAVRGLLAGAQRYRREIVEGFDAMGRRAVAAGERGGPFAFVVPEEQFDGEASTKLLTLLVQGGVEVHRALEPFKAGGHDYPAGTALVLMAQPFRAYAKTLLEKQDYPARRITPNGPPERPYDVAGWTLPYQMGVAVDAVDAPFALPAMARMDHAEIAPDRVWGEKKPSYFLVEARGIPGSVAVNRLVKAGVDVSWLLGPADALGYTYRPGSIAVRQTKASRAVVDALARELGLRVTGMKGRLPSNVLPVGTARVGLYKPWVENIDEGWTRLLLERYQFPFSTLADAEVRGGRLRDRYDVIVLPDAEPERLVAGHRAGVVPPEYAGGLGTQGVEALREFVDGGGTLVCLDSSCGLAISALGLPILDVVRDEKPDQFFCPGSILGLSLDPTQPLAFGMQEKTTAFFSYSAAYETKTTATAPPSGHGGVDPRATTTVVGRYAQENPLLSGWLEGGDRIAGRGAVVEARHGAGRVVLIGFRAQHRAQSYATFRLLFNAIHTGPAAPIAKKR